MKAKPPPGRRKFADVSEEMQYLYDKLLYWLYQRQDARRGRRFSDRLARVLVKANPEPESIFSAECRSLVHEAKGDLAKAIEHRVEGIRRIRQLHDIPQDTPQKEYIFRLYGYDDLSDRLDLLAVLYHDSGQLDKALATLVESKRLCKQHGIPFDGEDLMKEYQEEKRAAANGRTGNGRSKRRTAKVPSRRSG